MKAFLIRWLVTTVAVAVAVEWTGMWTEGWRPLLGTALLLGIINAVLRPLLMLLSLPFIIASLGFFILIVNALTLWLAGGVVPGFHVDGFWNAFFGSIIVSLASGLLNGLFPAATEPTGPVTEDPSEIEPGLKRVHGRTLDAK